MQISDGLLDAIFADAINYVFDTDNGDGMFGDKAESNERVRPTTVSVNPQTKLHNQLLPSQKHRKKAECSYLPATVTLEGAEFGCNRCERPW